MNNIIPEGYNIPLHLFHEGNNNKTYEFFGSHFEERNGRRELVFPL